MKWGISLNVLQKAAYWYRSQKDHVDTLGAMVSSITDQGTLKLTPLGGMNPNNAETENCRIITREGKAYTGTFQLCNASIHVNGEYNDTKRML